MGAQGGRPPPALTALRDQTGQSPVSPPHSEKQFRMTGGLSVPTDTPSSASHAREAKGSGGMSWGIFGAV